MSTFVLVQSTDLVSMVYSCIGAEIEDSDGSSERAGADAAIAEAPPDARSNGHVVPPRQERIVPLAETQVEPEEDGGTRPEPPPPPQSTKPGLAIMRQRHLQDSLGNTSRSLLLYLNK